MAALAHASVIATGIGIVVAAVIWLTQKEKSPFASTQAKHACFFQLGVMGLIILSWIVWSVLYMVVLMAMVGTMENDSEPGVWFWVVMMSWILPMIFMAFWWIFGLRGAWLSWHGKGYRYPVVSRLLADD